MEGTRNRDVASLWAQVGSGIGNLFSVENRVNATELRGVVGTEKVVVRVEDERRHAGVDTAADTLLADDDGIEPTPVLVMASQRLESTVVLPASLVIGANGFAIAARRPHRNKTVGANPRHNASH